MVRLVGLAALFGAGLLLAGGLAAGGVAEVSSTVTLPVTTTVSETTTEPATTVVTTEERTTTEKVTPTGTTTAASSTSKTPTWVWVVLAVLAAAVIGLIVALLTRHGGISAEERQRRLDSAVAGWAAQGWAVENQSPGSAILRRGPELMVVSIDDNGQTNVRPLGDSRGQGGPPGW